MKFHCLLLVLLLTIAATAQPPRIHAHNDYEQPEPLTNALRQQAFSIEADVYLVNDTLRVAHDAKNLAIAPSLNSLYLQPIIQLFRTHQGHISSDPWYSPVLVIDIKQNGEQVLAKLVQELSAAPTVFDRTVNPQAIQVIVSGERTAINNWKNYSSLILFDGRPYENYDSLSLQKIGFVSDAYYNYIRPADSTDIRIQQLAEKLHRMGKLVRLWATPDYPQAWEHLQKLGVDIINTDKVAECRNYFSN